MGPIGYFRTIHALEHSIGARIEHDQTDYAGELQGDPCVHVLRNEPS